MRAYLQQIAYRIQGSYWLIPSLMVITAIVLSQVTIWIDRTTGNQWIKEWWFASMNQPDGARALLATVAGSMITVAGVTFSLTILAVSHATSHFGPRLLDNFMRDRGNQITLGTFVATFLYCLLVLRVVRNAADGSGSGIDTGSFVPQLSLLIAFVLTIASVAELIYFIHHVPDSIHISTVLQRLATDMTRKIEELYPESIGEAMDSASHQEYATPDFEHKVTSNRSGYLQGIDDKDLIKFAKSNDTLIRLLRRPGQFVRENEVIAEVPAIDQWSEESADVIRFGFTIGFARTPTQDAFFTLNEFVEVATRALSPGVNDPFTAMQCIDWLSVGLVQLSQRKMPSAYRTDPDGDVRVITTEVTYADFVASMLGQLVPYVKRDENVKQYFISAMQQVTEISTNDELNRSVQHEIRRIRGESPNQNDVDAPGS